MNTLKRSVFIDTNILILAFDRVNQEEESIKKATEIVDEYISQDT